MKARPAVLVGRAAHGVSPGPPRRLPCSDGAVLSPPVGATPGTLALWGQAGRRVAAVSTGGGALSIAEAVRGSRPPLQVSTVHAVNVDRLNQSGPSHLGSW